MAVTKVAAGRLFVFCKRWGVEPGAQPAIGIEASYRIDPYLDIIYLLHRRWHPSRKLRGCTNQF